MSRPGLGRRAHRTIENPENINAINTRRTTMPKKMTRARKTLTEIVNALNDLSDLADTEHKDARTEKEQRFWEELEAQLYSLSCETLHKGRLNVR